MLTPGKKIKSVRVIIEAEDGSTETLQTGEAMIHGDVNRTRSGREKP